jgi:hypothetical protein
MKRYRVPLFIELAAQSAEEARTMLLGSLTTDWADDLAADYDDEAPRHICVLIGNTDEIEEVIQ